MQTVALILAAAAAVSAQGVTANIPAPGGAPAGCMATGNGEYHLTVVKAGSASKMKRAPALEVTLNNGILLDNKGRTGYIAANNQFQFDKPPQTGAIYTSGWSLCSNTSLALGSSTLFYECQSGSFGNLYNENVGAQCQPVNLDLLPAGGASAAPSSAAPASSAPASSAAPATSAAPMTSAAAPASSPAATQITDGQVQATTAGSAAVTQITDGQAQGPTSVPAFTGGAPVATAAAQLLAVAAGAIAMAF